MDRDIAQIEKISIESDDDIDTLMSFYNNNSGIIDSAMNEILDAFKDGDTTRAMGTFIEYVLGAYISGVQDASREEA